MVLMIHRASAASRVVLLRFRFELKLGKLVSKVIFVLGHADSKDPCSFRDFIITNLLPTYKSMHNVACNI